MIVLPLLTRLIGTLLPILDCTRLCPVGLRLLQLPLQQIDLALLVRHVLTLCLVIGFEFVYPPIQGKTVREYNMTIDLPSLDLDFGV